MNATFFRRDASLWIESKFRISQLLVKGRRRTSKTGKRFAMNWFGNYFSKFPEDASLLSLHSPLLLSLISSEDEHFLSSVR